MKKAVVTGANGFVGSNLIKELLNHGYMVYAVVRSRDSNMGRIPKSGKIQTIFCDLKDIGSLPGLLHGEKAGLFFTLGGKGRLETPGAIISCNLIMPSMRVTLSALLRNWGVKGLCLQGALWNTKQRRIFLKEI